MLVSKKWLIRIHTNPPKMRNYIKNKDNGYSFDKKNVMKQRETVI